MEQNQPIILQESLMKNEKNIQFLRSLIVSILVVTISIFLWSQPSVAQTIGRKIKTSTITEGDDIVPYRTLFKVFNKKHFQQGRGKGRIIGSGTNPLIGNVEFGNFKELFLQNKLILDYNKFNNLHVKQMNQQQIHTMAIETNKKYQLYKLLQKQKIIDQNKLSVPLQKAMQPIVGKFRGGIIPFIGPAYSFVKTIQRVLGENKKADDKKNNNDVTEFLSKNFGEYQSKNKTFGNFNPLVNPWVALVLITSLLLGKKGVLQGEKIIERILPKKNPRTWKEFLIHNMNSSIEFFLKYPYLLVIVALIFYYKTNILKLFTEKDYGDSVSKQLIDVIKSQVDNLTSAKDYSINILKDFTNQMMSKNDQAHNRDLNQIKDHNREIRRLSSLKDEQNKIMNKKDLLINNLENQNIQCHDLNDKYVSQLIKVEKDIQNGLYSTNTQINNNNLIDSSSPSPKEGETIGFTLKQKAEQHNSYLINKIKENEQDILNLENDVIILYPDTKIEYTNQPKIITPEDEILLQQYELDKSLIKYSEKFKNPGLKFAERILNLFLHH
jgi:hypothetical protein